MYAALQIIPIKKRKDFLNMKRKKPLEYVPVDKLIGTGEAAGITGLPDYIVRKLCDERKIEAFRVLGRWRMRRSSIENYLASVCNQGGPQ